ncbi:hypothetical protein UP09_28130 [Bradyrhizobium sp. LTSP885]|uniref:phage tail sheath family protein n=1 Tax=Bradyrhizobium sp. LTSP885 TaxID=1619232 RepID=UPI0005CA840C|nr:phage tail sheath C-terminal domain-containing protein [Bradyrhizobium sp. LTSP885]KJC37123.1 hypothetical protein UP09_28130 [Bradyrhizobium sp. LTSP885]
MAQPKTPGVFIQEVTSFPNSIVEVETAVPAFIGYTEIAADGARSLHRTPFRLSSLTEYKAHFGGAPVTQFEFGPMPDDWSAQTSFVLQEPGTSALGADTDSHVAHARYYLYYALRLFFANGGGPCYIVSVGSYDNAITKDDLQAGLDLLTEQPDATMIVIADTMSLSRQDAEAIQRATLSHCADLASCVAILDVFAGSSGLSENDPIGNFRSGIGLVGLDYGAAYYPWLATFIVEFEDITIAFLTANARGTLLDRLNDFVAKRPDAPTLKNFVRDLGLAPASQPAAPALRQAAHHALQAIVPFYQSLMLALQSAVNLLPPSGAIAGVYARTDFTRGVFKAPAGVDISSVVKPAVALSDADVQDLNLPLDGKAVNAIRAFPGRGVLVWGARTLNGNSEDTRYVSVRRTLIMFEQSIKQALQSFALEPNTPATWSAVASEIDNFLINQWKAGALFGATPVQAFSVTVGLGTSMSHDDVANGVLKVIVSVALVRPAEFISLSFEQMVQPP